MKNKKLLKPRIFTQTQRAQVSAIEVEYCDACGGGQMSLQRRFTRNGCNLKLRCGWAVSKR